LLIPVYFAITAHLKLKELQAEIVANEHKIIEFQKMHKEIFNADDFSQWANQKLILVNADFPREKKHQLPKNIQEQNNRLADSYNPKGIFPFTVLIDENGTVLRSWEGYPKTSPPEFIQEITATLSKNQKK
jgi:thioredoxin-related protein